MDARAATKTLGGQWHGSYGLAKCPAHNDKTPSLQISDSSNGGEMMVHCHAGCAWQDIKDALRSQGVMPEWAANNITAPGLLMNGKPISIGANGVGAPHAAPGAGVPPEPENNNRQHALELWNAASKAGPIAATYLRSRGISIAAPGSIREMAGLKHGPSGQILPCLIAAVQGPDGKIIAVHRTYLCADYTAKASVSPQKMALGSIKGGKVRLAKAAPTLAVCEGIETGLSIQEKYGLPTWCALGASNLPNMVLHLEVRRVVVCADTGAAGMAAAEKAAARFDSEGREVFIARPPDGVGDFNDLICQ